MLAILLSIIVLFITLGVLLNSNHLLNLPAFILTIILCFIINIINLLTMTLPLGLFIVMILAIIGLFIKHSHLFTLKKGAKFLRKMFKHLIHGTLIISILFYISTIPIPIVNGIFLWLSMIAFSACYAFTLYMVWSSAFGRTMTTKQYDLIMILGAGIFSEQVTPMLADRLERALHVLESQPPNCKVLVSGGKGPDEPITEALAMQRYLIDRGVPASSIIMEDQSTSTYENFVFSKDIIADHFSRSAKMLCVTSQFHILRGLYFARTVRLDMEGIGSHTPYHFFDIALVRDFLALMYQYKLLLGFYFAITFFISILIIF
ncbi:YdcF family protein [Staphylococcus pragensis]|uniref:YdcF family protein n=1 Tax=Staphylococcus pragensis TaxID=1611836 RepID=A0A4Z1BP90_9STAP|nr:YdcF family protein [Staphylococcus pragensis]RTX90119.1 YdcF family protein [Staphylococcus carnosus]TGN27560.1 YdcF family protein [Staphylococcus pragensis]GGG91758.1 membrane protein [Staphylococcus pragensis]